MTCTRGDESSREELGRDLREHVRRKAKPVGALGRIEELAVKIGLIKGAAKPDLGMARILVFAGDHGLTAEGITAYPSYLTREIAALILSGGAGINALARAAHTEVKLVDTGLLEPLPSHDALIEHRIASGTANSRVRPAMTASEFARALDAGRAIDAQLEADGVGVVGYGEVGIGNSSAAALIAHTLTGLPLDTLVGPGAGLPPLGLDYKRRVLAEASARAAIVSSAAADRAAAALREFGGFEIATMAGAMSAAASAGRVIVVDGFISTSAAIAAEALSPGVLGNCIFAHCSGEPGHKVLLDHLGIRALLDLDMRLGEGTGAALAIPIIRAAELMLRDMADLPGEHPA